MKTTLTLILFALACRISLTAGDTTVVRRDTYFPVVLQTVISTETAKAGDQVIFRTTQGVLIGNNIVVPSGAEVMGTIDEVQWNRANGPRSVLVIRFHAVRWPDGRVGLNAVVSGVEKATPYEKSFLRPIKNVFSRPTLLEHINIYAHIQRSAFTEFTSDQARFALRPGIRLVLRHLEPDREPSLMVKNMVLDVNRGWKN
jgi:hypothetical protein